MLACPLNMYIEFIHMWNPELKVVGVSLTTKIINKLPLDKWANSFAVLGIFRHLHSEIRHGREFLARNGLDCITHYVWVNLWLKSLDAISCLVIVEVRQDFMGKKLTQLGI